MMNAWELGLEDIHAYIDDAFHVGNGKGVACTPCVDEDELPDKQVVFFEIENDFLVIDAQQIPLVVG